MKFDGSQINASDITIMQGAAERRVLRGWKTVTIFLAAWRSLQVGEPGMVGRRRVDAMFGSEDCDKQRLSCRSVAAQQHKQITIH